MSRRNWCRWGFDRRLGLARVPTGCVGLSGTSPHPAQLRWGFPSPATGEGDFARILPVLGHDRDRRSDLHAVGSLGRPGSSRSCLRRPLRTPSWPCRSRSRRGYRPTSPRRPPSPAIRQECPPPSSAKGRASSVRSASGHVPQRGSGGSKPMPRARSSASWPFGLRASERDDAVGGVMTDVGAAAVGDA